MACSLLLPPHISTCSHTTTMGSSHSSVVQSLPSVQSLNEKESQDTCGHMTVTSEPVSVDGSISLRNVEGWEEKVAKDPKVQLARTILVDTDYKAALASRDTKVADAHVFNLQLDFKTDPITSQKSSGRCWLFATTNVLRYSVMQKLNLKEFQLSQVRVSDSTSQNALICQSVLVVFVHVGQTQQE